MKARIKLTLLIGLWAGIAYGQDRPEVVQLTRSQLDSLIGEKLTEEYEYQLGTFISKTDSLKVLIEDEVEESTLNKGILASKYGLPIDRISTYVTKEDNDQNKTVQPYILLDIESIKIKIKDSSIEKVSFYCEGNSVFVNPWSPIYLGSFTNFNSHPKIYSTSNFGLKANLKDHLRFDPDDFNYRIMDDLSLVLKPTESQTVSFKGDINSLIEFSVYSDLLALIDNQSNGLVQVEGKAQFPLNNRNYGTTATKFLRYVNVVGSVSKFDSEYQTLPASFDSTTSKLTFDPFQLYQQSYLFTSLQPNVFSWEKEHIEFGLNGYFAFNQSRLEVETNETEDLSIVTLGGDFYFEVEPVSGFGLDLRFRYFMSQDVLTDDRFNTIDNYDAFSPLFTLYYQNPNSKTSKFFLRFTYFTNFDNEGDSFNTLQFGYKTNFVSHLKPKEKAN